MPRPTRHSVAPLISAALREDGARADLTSRAVLPKDTPVRAQIVAKAAGVIAGGQVAGWVFAAMDRRMRYRQVVPEGQAVRPGQVIATVNGDARSVFAAERVALNLLGHLSGIATAARAYVRRAQGTQAKIFDTRKTLPGLRRLQKYAVRIGGGRNHRADLRDAVLIKTNHLRALQGAGMTRAAAIRQAVARARRRAGGRWLEIEAATLADMRIALEVRPDAILLDNMSVRQVRAAVQARGRRRRIQLEVSGGITPVNVRAYAATGVDRISIGRLTHAAPSLDFALRARSPGRPSWTGSSSSPT